MNRTSTFLASCSGVSLAPSPPRTMRSSRMNARTLATVDGASADCSRDCATTVPPVALLAFDRSRTDVVLLRIRPNPIPPTLVLS